MFTHTENISLLVLGTVQGALLARLLLPHTELPDLLVWVVSWLIGMILAALEFTPVAKLRGK
jgi:hypothetical protein